MQLNVQQKMQSLIISDIVKFECHNAFDVLSDWSKEGKQYDVVILDPPAFTKSRTTIRWC